MSELRQFTIMFKIRMIGLYERLQDGRPLRQRSLGFVSKRIGIARQTLILWIKTKDVEKLEKNSSRDDPV